MDRADEFYKLAKEYYTYITETEISNDSVNMLMELLMKLYISAMKLPDMEPDTTDRLSSDSINPVIIKINENIIPYYWEVFDPAVQDEPVCGYLADDLSDIAVDLLNGINEYDAGRIGNAVFEWKLGSNSHWGSHAVDALRALHSIRGK